MMKITRTLLILPFFLTPAAVSAQVQATAETENSTWIPSDAELLDYRQWYPFHRNQARGQRTLHWWHNQGLDDENLRGQSTYRYVTQPPNSTLPRRYDGKSVEYYLQWYCEQFRTDAQGTKIYDPDPECKKLNGRWLEVQSEHRRSSKTIALLSWGFGREHNWSVFFRPDTFSSCDKDTVAAELMVQPGLKTTPSERMPLQWFAPRAISTPNDYVEVYGPVVCKVVFGDFDMNNVVSARESFISATREDYQGANKVDDGRPVQLLINAYYERCTDDDCSITPSCLSADDIEDYLDPVPGESSVRLHLFETEKVRNGASYCVTSYEPFWTRKTQVVDGVRHHGMGYWSIVGPGWTFSALDRNYTILEGQEFCEETFPLPWLDLNGWNSHVACAHDPTAGGDAP